MDPTTSKLNKWNTSNIRGIQQRNRKNDRHARIKKPPKQKREEWDESISNEYGRLMKGIGKKRKGKRWVQRFNTFHFIQKDQVPKQRKVTYVRFCHDVKPQKNRTRMTARGDWLEYDNETTTEKASVETSKILIKSTISTERVRFACWDVGNFYTNSRLKIPEYMWVHIKGIPEEVREGYNVMQFVDEDGYIYCKTTETIYELAQAG